jgi:hypothetical protein
MVARLAPDIEQGRRLPAELVSALKSARIYGMLVPRRYGGLELDAPSAFRPSVCGGAVRGAHAQRRAWSHASTLTPVGPLAMPSGSAEHRLGMSGDVDRDGLLHGPSGDMGSRDPIVLAVVAEEILRKGTVEDVAKLFGSLWNRA